MQILPTLWETVYWEINNEMMYWNILIAAVVLSTRPVAAHTCKFNYGIMEICGEP